LGDPAVNSVVSLGDPAGGPKAMGCEVIGDEPGPKGMALELLPFADFDGDEVGANGLSPASGCFIMGLLPVPSSSSPSSAAKSAASGI